MRYFLGIDGGQSSTRCLVGDESGHVVAVGRAGPCNHVGAELGRERFLSAIEGCLRDAGFYGSTFEAACLGLSGGPADKDALARESIRAERYFVTHDAMIALAGATDGAPGIITIAGTGSIAFGRNAAGETARAGGWGYIFGDEGSAFDIVRQAVRATVRYEEGWGSETALYAMLLDRCEASSANDLLHRFYTSEYPRERIAALATVVDEAARGGDAIALELMGAAAQLLAVLSSSVRRQLFGSGEPVRQVPVGGVFRSDVVHQRFRMLVEMEDGCFIADPLHGPAAGALLEAYRIAGITCTLKDVPEGL